MFESARLKAERASEHINEFRSAFQAFIDGHPYSIACDGRRELSYSLVMTQDVPAQVMVIAGDAIHNLRAALDHCVWAIWTNDVARENQTAKWARRIKLPSSSTNGTDYIASIDGMAHACGGRGDAISLLKELAIYPGGGTLGEALLALHNLDIDDKHCILTPVMLSCKITGLIEVTKTYDGDTLTNRLPDRTVMLTPNFADYRQVYPAGALFVGSYSPGPYSPKLSFSEDHNLVLKIMFAENQPFPGMGIIPSLEQLGQLVLATIGKFESMIANRC